MADAITHISTTTPSGSSSSYLFTSIPQTYDDLLLIGTLKGAGASWGPATSYLYFGTAGSEWTTSGQYNYQMLYDRYANNTFLGYANNYASAGTSDKINAWPIPGSQNDANNPAGWWLYLPGYSNTTNSVGKGFQMFAGCISTSLNSEQIVNLTTGTMPGGVTGPNGAIDTMSFYSGVGNFTASSKLSLYGIKNS